MKPGHVLLDLQRQFPFGEIGLVQPRVVGPPLHGSDVLDRVQERRRPRPGRGCNCALKCCFEQHHVAVGHRGVDEVVDQEVESHPGDMPNTVARRNTTVLGLLKSPARPGPWCGRRARSAPGACPHRSNLAGRRAVAAIRVGIDDRLALAAEAVDEPDGAEVGGFGQQGVGIARGRPDDRRQRDDDVGFLDQPSDQRLVGTSPSDEIIVRVGTKMERTTLVPEEPVHDRHTIAGVEEVLGEDGAEVTGTTVTNT